MKFITNFSLKDSQRYSRQLILKEMTIETHQKISTTTVLIIGMGGLGSPVLTYLSTSGINKIIIADHDKVELNNLGRQTIHKERNISKDKTTSAEELIKELNQDIEITSFNEKIDKNNLERIAKKADLLVDCTDDLETRYLISEYCKRTKKTVIMASVLKFYGQVYVFPRGESCYSCVFPKFKVTKDNCSTAGVLGPVCGIIGSMQATEVIKNIINHYDPYILNYDAMNNTFSKIKVRKCFKDCKKAEILQEEMKENKEMKGKKEMKENKEMKEMNYFIEWNKILENEDKYQLVDLRDEKSFNLCHLEGSINIPMGNGDFNIENKIIVLVCKKGISAQKIWYKLNDNNILVVKGGLTAYRNNIDNNFILF